MYVELRNNSLAFFDKFNSKREMYDKLINNIISVVIYDFLPSVYKICDASAIEISRFDSKNLSNQALGSTSLLNDTPCKVFESGRER